MTAFKYTCTGCGRAFCSSCCSNYVNLTKEDLLPGAPALSDFSKPHKCCSDCSDRVKQKKPLLKVTPAATAAPEVQSTPTTPKNKDINELYTIGKVLGEGGFGIVKEGISKKTNERVAVKILLKEKIPPDEESAIYNEVNVLSKLHHKNIVHLYDFLVEPTSFYIVMECVQGGELFDRIVKKTVYNEHEARELVIILLKAIKYCHDKHIVHRYNSMFFASIIVII